MFNELLSEQTAGYQAVINRDSTGSGAESAGRKWCKCR